MTRGPVVVTMVVMGVVPMRVVVMPVLPMPVVVTMVVVGVVRPGLVPLRGGVRVRVWMIVLVAVGSVGVLPVLRGRLRCVVMRVTVARPACHHHPTVRDCGPGSGASFRPRDISGRVRQISHERQVAIGFHPRGSLIDLHRSPTRDSAATRAYRQLKDRILTCQLAPGASLNEGRLAEAMELSKTPVREALAMLAHEGFVEVLPRQGYRVTDLTVADVQELFHLRLLLEPAAAALAAERATADQLHQLRELADDRAAPSDPAGYETFVIRDREFHTRLAEASGNRRLATALGAVLDAMQRLFLAGLDLRETTDDQRREHRELLAALLKGNHHLAHDIAVRQIESSRERVMGALLAAMSSPAAPRRSAEVARPGRRGESDR